MKKILLLITLIIFTLSVSLQAKERESYYQKLFAEAINGETEFVLPDRARVDILNETYAIEVDFAAKWAESVGQALYYSEMTGKRAGVLLVVNGDNDEQHIKRLMTLAAKYGITVWIMDYNDESWSKVEVIVEYKR